MEARSRAQSETVGVLLLTAVSVVLAATIGLFVVSSVVSTADDDPLVDVEGNATADHVTVHHAGGESLRAAAVEVVVEGSSRQRYGLGSFEQRRGADDSRFEAGDSWRRPNEVGGGPLEISVIDGESNEIVDGETVGIAVDVSARFTYQPTTTAPGETITFDASATEVRGSSIDTYEWAFDDGATATGARPTHRFDDGSYDVTLTVTSDAGESTSTTRTVQVANVAPTAAFETRLSEGPYGGTYIVYDASASSDPDGSIDRYQWDVDGDGDVEIDTTDPTASELEFDPATGDVTLTVTDDDGATTAVTRGGEYQPTPGFEAFAVVVAVLLGAGLRRRGYL